MRKTLSYFGLILGGLWIWVLSSSLLIGPAKGQNAVVRNTGNATVYDLGAQVVNVKAYGAVGNGSTDDTTAINLARAAAQANKMPMYFPGGIYCVGGGGVGITLGDGSSTQNNTLPSVQVWGAGHGYYLTSNPAPTTIKWCGSAPGASQYIFSIAGPQAGGAMRDLVLDINSTNNVGGVLFTQTAYFDMTNVTIIRNTNGYGIEGTTIRDGGSGNDFGNCNNTLRNVNIQQPGTGARGALLTGVDQTKGTTCSWTIIGGDWWHDGNTASTSSLELKGVDNLRVWGTNFYSSVPLNGNATRCGLKFAQWSAQTAFPQENTFISIQANDGICGTYGTGAPNIFVAWTIGDCFTNCNPEDLSGTHPVVMGGSHRDVTGVAAIDQINQTTGNLVNYWFRGRDVLDTVLYYLKRGGESGNGMEWYSFAEMLFQPIGDMIYRREGTNGQLYLKNYSSTSSNRDALIFERASGTFASPSFIGNGYVLGAIAASGRNAGGTQSFAHRINLVCDTVDGSNICNESSIRFATTDGTFADHWIMRGNGKLEAQTNDARIQLVMTTTAQLPSCNSGNNGIIGYVSDATTPTFLGSLTGGGSTRTKVLCNGTNWVTQ